MSTLDHLQKGLNTAWDSMVGGWQQLYRRATGAITRFRPSRYGGQGEAVSTTDLALRSAGWGVLAAEVYEDDDAVTLRLEAPGMDKGDFRVSVIDDQLVVRGEKKAGREHTRGHYYVTECAYGFFERVIPLPESVDSDGARASYRSGVLSIELPKLEARRRRTIRVDVQ